MTTRLLLPGMPGFQETLASPPPDPGQDYAYVVRPGAAGVPECVTEDGLNEYLKGGEYEARLLELEQDNAQAIPINAGLHSDILYLPKTVSFG